MTKKRKAKSPPIPPLNDPPNGPTPELLVRIETRIEETEIAGTMRRRLLPAHKRLRKSGKIDREVETEIDEYVDAYVAAFGAERGVGSGDMGGSIITRQMLMADRVRRIDARIGASAARLLVDACVDCLPGAILAMRHLGFAPPDPEDGKRPRRRRHGWIPDQWWDAGRKQIDAVLVPLFKFVALPPQKPVDKHTANQRNALCLPKVGHPPSRTSRR